MRSLIGAALLLVPTSSAFAGGLGIMATGGIHTERHFYYSDTSPDGEPYRAIEDYDQYQFNPLIPQAGGGLELLLGDRDDRIQGSMRFFYSAELPPPDPAGLDPNVDPDHIVADLREGIRHLGFGMVGLNWGVVGDPGGFQFVLTAHVGAAFLSLDHNEFLAVQAGPGVSWRMSRQLQLFADVQYQARFQKTEFGHAGQGNVGLRFLFD